MTRDSRSLGAGGGENGERVDHENEPAGFMNCRAMPGDRLGAIAEVDRPSPCVRRSKDTCNSAGEMVPVGSVADLKSVTVPYRVPRYNLYPAAEVQGVAASGVATGTALHRMEE